jgi:hypothetical protein
MTRNPFNDEPLRISIDPGQQPNIANSPPPVPALPPMWPQAIPPADPTTRPPALDRAQEPPRR